MKKLFALVFCYSSINIAYSQCYDISSINYIYENLKGTEIQLDDNQYSSTLPIGFNFCFYGITTDSLQIGSNGIIRFKDDNWGDVCKPEIPDVTLPNGFTSISPKNCIMFPWQDLDPSIGGIISYSIQGLEPNRYFLVSFDSVPLKNCEKYFTGQVKIYEGTNNIETFIEHKDTCQSWNEGKAVHGLQGTSGLNVENNILWTTGDFISGRNYPSLDWIVENEGILFSPICDVCLTPSIAGYSTNSNNNLPLFYPNPVERFLNIENSISNIDINIDILSIDGKIIKKINSKINNAKTIDLIDLNSGIYYLRLTNQYNGTFSTHKFIKK